jgi:SPP1 family predicted phage head-tail adaptor
MDAGILDRRVTIMKRVYGTNEYNEPKTVSYQDIDTDPEVWAHKAELSGALPQETYMGDQLIGEVTDKWIIRYRTDLDATMVLIYNNKIHEIESIREAAGKEFSRYEAIEIRTFIRDAPSSGLGGGFDSGFDSGFN